MRNEMITAANRKRMTEGVADFERLKDRCRKPMEVNKELLLKIIRDNEDTEYGKKYDFKNIHSIEDYQKKVPVTKYADYSENIKRMVNTSEKNLTCAYPVGHFNGSSGTTGDVKYIPMPKEMIDVYLAYVTHSPLGVLTETVGEGWIEGRCIRLAECPSEVYHLPSGASFGAISSHMTRQFRPNIESLFTSPDEAIFPQSGTNTRYLHARFALMDEDAAGLMAAYLSFLLLTFRYIESNWEMLVRDIETGTIDPSVELQPEVMDHLKDKLIPMPERAAALREIFSKGFEEPFAPKVWKNMKYVLGIGTGGFKVYADLLQSRYTGKDIPFVKIGICASEGVFTTPYRVNSEDSVLIPDSVFFEFLPLDAEDDFSKIVTIDGLEEGKDYELIITNMGGFYRYRMRDAVRVVSKFENTPTVEYLYRIDQTINIMGEKTTEATLRAAANNTAESLDFELVDFSVYADIKSTPPRYQYFLEIGNKPADVSPNLIRRTLEKELLKLAPAFRDLVSRGLCQGLKVNFLQEDAYALWRDLAIYNGANSNQLKPVHIIRTENQRRFFFGMTEYSSEPIQ